MIDTARENELVALLYDDSIATRVNAAGELGEASSEVAAAALLGLAGDDAAPTDVVRAAARALARVCFRRRGDLTDMALAQLTDDGYLAYDTEMGALEKSQPDVKIRHRTVGPGVV